MEDTVAVNFEGWTWKRLVLVSIIYSDILKVSVHSWEFACAPSIPCKGNRESLIVCYARYRDCGLLRSLWWCETACRLSCARDVQLSALAGGKLVCWIMVTSHGAGKYLESVYLWNAFLIFKLPSSIMEYSGTIMETVWIAGVELIW